jgi:hypothetical protein
VNHNHHPRKTWRTNLVVLIALWVILLVASLTVLSSVITPFLKTLQTASIGSLTWAGYVVSSDLLFQQPIVEGVNGSWVVPRVSVSTNDTFSSAWIGIGGQLDNTLIQCGTEHDSLGGQEVYSVWYELLPNNSVTVESMTVSPGDVITASISLVNSSANNWQIQIVDNTSGQSFRQVFAYNSSQLSAEWIVERPNVNNKVSSIADFGSVTFIGAYAQLGSKVGTISSFSNYEVTMNDLQNNQLATVSPLSRDGSSFTVTFQQPT